MKRPIPVALTTSALAAPAMAQEIEEFRIGILGGENAQDRLASNQCLADYVTEALGVPVRVFAPADCNGVIQGLLGGSIDPAWLGASACAATCLADPEAVEPVLVKTNLDGAFGSHSIGFARADSGITSLDEMRGKVFAFGDPNSSSGCLIPSVEIPAATGGTTEPGDHFGDVVFAGGQQQTIVAVANGDVDAGETWAGGLGTWEDGYNPGATRKASDAGLVEMNGLVAIWKSKPIPKGPIVLRRALPDPVKAAVTGIMNGLHERHADCACSVAAGEAAGFMPIGHDACETIIALRQAEMN